MLPWRYSRRSCKVVTSGHLRRMQTVMAKPLEAAVSFGYNANSTMILAVLSAPCMKLVSKLCKVKRHACSYPTECLKKGDSWLHQGEKRDSSGFRQRRTEIDWHDHER